MRQQRIELSNMYNSNPDGFKKQLEQIRKKYQNRFKIVQNHNAK